ncbi:MMS19 nucleotide excision repair protein homolog isoform X1 [Tanacetum coccineum]
MRRLFYHAGLMDEILDNNENGIEVYLEERYGEFFKKLRGCEKDYLCEAMKRYMLHRALTHVITNTPLSAIMGEANKLVCETAIQCLTAMPELPYVTIYRFSTEVLQALSRALDDPKRSVRQEACYTSAVLKVHKTGDISVLPDVHAVVVVQALALRGGLEVAK